MSGFLIFKWLATEEKCLRGVLILMPFLGNRFVWWTRLFMVSYFWTVINTSLFMFCWTVIHTVLRIWPVWIANNAQNVFFSICCFLQSLMFILCDGEAYQSFIFCLNAWMCSKQFIFNFLVLGLTSSFSSKTTKWNLARHNWRRMCKKRSKASVHFRFFIISYIYKQGCP